MTAMSEKFIYEIYPAAKKDLEISPVFTTAQAGLESGWGKSRCGSFGLFGEKTGKGWTGKRVLCPTTEIAKSQAELEWFKKNLPEITSITPTGRGYFLIHCKDWFKDFASVEDCLKQHFKLLHSANFKHALVNGRDPIAYVKDLQDNAAGHNYATATNYVAVMCSIFPQVEAVAKRYKL
jgi:flagellum-specific peptidoglycan hydrolase FlgJ